MARLYSFHGFIWLIYWSSKVTRNNTPKEQNLGTNQGTIYLKNKVYNTIYNSTLENEIRKRLKFK